MTVLVPGFSQTKETWRPVCTDLVGATPIEIPRERPFTETALAIGDERGRATYVGYSLGGRLCLRLALERPDLVNRLVLVSTSPGIADSDERAARRADDERLATEVEQDGADAFLERWLAQPLFATLDAADRGDRIRDVATLAHQLRALGQGAMEPLWDRLGELAMPVELVVGGLDDKYRRLGGEMAQQIADRRLHVIPAVGHAVHLETPTALVRILQLTR